jgi:hypothetical protein
MSTIKQEESARSAARDAALLKKLKEYLQSDDIPKRVRSLPKSPSLTIEAIPLTHTALAIVA